jgi:predicted O-methyltransferase YrrM
MPGELDYDVVQTYLETLVPPRPPELAAMEEIARLQDFPIIGPVAGQTCYQLARLIKARRIFELGSGYGYSTAWFARAVWENCEAEGLDPAAHGEVHHVVWDEALSQRARRHLDVLGYSPIVRYHVGEAVAALRESKGGFDIVFNDIDKQAYPQSLPVIDQKLRSGGVLVVDNMLWHGRIFQPEDRSPSTLGVHETTRLLATEEQWIVTLLPLRDGLIVAYKQ